MFSWDLTWPPREKGLFFPFLVCNFLVRPLWSPQCICLEALILYHCPGYCHFINKTRPRDSMGVVNGSRIHRKVKVAVKGIFCSPLNAIYNSRKKRWMVISTITLRNLFDDLTNSMEFIAPRMRSIVKFFPTSAGNSICFVPIQTVMFVHVLLLPLCFGCLELKSCNANVVFKNMAIFQFLFFIRILITFRPSI